MQVEDKLKNIRTEKDSLSRSIGRIEGEISSLLRLVKKQQEANANALHKTVELGSVENLAKEIDLEIDGVIQSIDIWKIKEIFASIKKILKNFIEKHKETEAKQEINDLEDEIKKLETEKKGYETKIAETSKSETELSEQYAFLKNEIEKERDSNRDAEKAMFRIVAEQNDIRGKLATIENREARLRHDEEELKRELSEGSILVGVSALHYKDFWPTNDTGATLSAEEIVKEDRQIQEDRRRAIEKIKIRLEDAGVAGGDEIVKEFKETEERDTFLARELEDLIKSSESLKNLIKELDEKLTSEFKLGVTKINHEFQKFFSAMFGGG